MRQYVKGLTNLVFVLPLTEHFVKAQHCTNRVPGCTYLL